MPRLVNLVIIIAAIAAAAAGGVVLFLRDGDGGEPVRIIAPATVSSVEARGETELKAYVTGAVRHPGLYAIEDGDRLADLIALAGGITEDADMQAVNLAVRVKDQDHWTVPKVGEPTLVPPNAVSVEPTSDKIDINTADADAAGDPCPASARRGRRPSSTIVRSTGRSSRSTTSPPCPG